ncbi:MAG: hypothetical protein MPJ50_08045 [Pirellulales bacterium]|nr:hypothetical protein [Pirellulales bacterium]
MAQTRHAQQLTSNGTDTITGNLGVKFSSMLTVNPLWCSAARMSAENTQNLTNVNFARTRESKAPLALLSGHVRALWSKFRRR